MLVRHVSHLGQARRYFKFGVKALPRRIADTPAIFDLLFKIKQLLAELNGVAPSAQLIGAGSAAVPPFILLLDAIPNQLELTLITVIHLLLVLDNFLLLTLDKLLESLPLSLRLANPLTRLVLLQLIVLHFLVRAEITRRVMKHLHQRRWWKLRGSKL